MPELRPHQKDGVLLMKRFKRFGLWYAPGTGKTAMCLKFLEEVQPWPTLVLCPLSIVGPAWATDARKFTPGLTVTALSGSKSVRNALSNVSSTPSKHTDWNTKTCIVMNYEAMRLNFQSISEIPWRCVILDESTRVKNPEAKLTKAVHALTRTKNVEYVFCLSGCPTPRHLLDWWAQVHTFSPDTLEPTYHAHRNTWFFQPSSQEHTWWWEPRRGAREAITERVAQVSAFLRREDAVEMPPILPDQVREVSLSRVERKAYDQFLRDWILSLPEGDVVGTTKAVEMMKCRQMTAGFARTRNGVWTEIGKSKLRALEELIDDIGKQPDGTIVPLIIVGVFRKELERFTERLVKCDRAPALLYGGLSEEKRGDAIRGFQDGSYDTLCIHPASAGHGLSFPSCADMIFTSVDYNYEYHYQVTSRILGIGRSKKDRPVSYYYLLAKDTIDEEIYYNSLSKKRSMTQRQVQEFRETMARKYKLETYQ